MLRWVGLWWEFGGSSNGSGEFERTRARRDGRVTRERIARFRFLGGPKSVGLCALGKRAPTILGGLPILANLELSSIAERQKTTTSPCYAKDKGKNFPLVGADKEAEKCLRCPVGRYLLVR